MTNGFDRLAAPYRWMEYLTFGATLERCRFHFLPELVRARRALILGDGDGRFTARLLQTSSEVEVLAVDGSAAMLRATLQRAGRDRLKTMQADLSAGLPTTLPDESYDLVATHFFLDCLNAEEVERLTGDVAQVMRPGAMWVVSEFDVPSNAWHWPARLAVRGMYLCFRLMTGLLTQRLPDWRAALERHGLRCCRRRAFLAGFVVAEVWSRGPDSSLSNAAGLES